MSRPVPSHHVVLVRQADAEVLGGPSVTGRLYADNSATGGALSSQRITLQHGAAGATPHHHTGSSELFYVISGAAEMLTGEQVHTVGEQARRHVGAGVWWGVGEDVMEHRDHFPLGGETCGLARWLRLLLICTLLPLAQGMQGRWARSRGTFRDLPTQGRKYLGNC